MPTKTSIPTILSEADFRREIKSSPATAYLLFGEEDYLKANAIAQAKELLGGDPTFACFNDMTIDALDFTPDTLRAALMPLPMMADRKIVLVRGLDFTAMRPADVDALCKVLADLPEYDYNLLLISVPSGAIDEGFLPKRPSSLLCRLGENVSLVRFERCTPAKLNGWCIRHFAHNGVEASPEMCAKLMDTCGRSMFTLASEIDKISFYALSHNRKTVTEEDILTAACPTAEYDTFAFTNALSERDSATALAILSDLKSRRTEPVIILGEVIRVVCDMLSVHRLQSTGCPPSEIATILKLHEFKVSLYQKQLAKTDEERLKKMLQCCMDADRALKLSPQGYLAIERLICTI